MARLIDADDAILQIERREKYLTGDRFISVDAVKEFIKNRPTIDPVKHGKWIWGKNIMNQYGAWCSECECGWEEKGDNFWRVQHLVISHQYCPTCGARMDGE